MSSPPRILFLLFLMFGSKVIDFVRDVQFINIIYQNNLYSLFRIMESVLVRLYELFLETLNLET
jgi:hypothetical protein